jgi:DNA-directed RNA polymerase
MVASDRPGDVYTEVAVATQARVAADSLGGNAIASSLVDHVDRGVVKQTVMTTVYGVTMVGAREQLRERLKEKGFEGQALHDASNYLQKVVFDSIGNVCQSAKDAMLWIRECAGIIAKAGHAVRWDTPLGFPVVQPYRRSRMIRVRSGGKRVKINVESGPVRVSRQRQAAAPNFVHSIDSTHMFLTARQMALDGLWFAAVHDSFWTHAASTDAMHAILRAKFVDLHDKPLLTDLRDQWHRRYGLDLPDAPPVGDFDIRSVLTSPYFFS